MKHLPNIISGFRIFCSLVLLFLKPLSALFFIIYIICGASDFLDGYIARKTKHTSQLGATIDSIADTIFFSVLLILFLPLLRIPLWILIWIGVIIIIRVTSLITGMVKYRTFAFLHTYANKATGFAVFCFPFLYNWLGLTVTAILLCGMASLSALEELIINFISKKLSRDIKSIWGLKFDNKHHKN